MNLLEVRVKHKIWGDGIVTKVEGKTIYIQFKTREAKFEYPMAFENFLSVYDESIQATIKKDIVEAKQAIEDLKKAKELSREEDVKKQTLIKETGPSSIRSSKRSRNIEDGFGSDYNVQHLAREPILTYKQVEEQFGIKISGFGRGINRTPSKVVLISSIDKKKTGFVYHDHWTTEGDYIYSGEGKNGNQSLTAGNRAIIDAEKTDKEIHLFIKFSPQEYYYQGVFKLVDYIFEDDVDESGNTRKEYKFRLRKLCKE